MLQTTPEAMIVGLVSDELKRRGVTADFYIVLFVRAYAALVYQDLSGEPELYPSFSFSLEAKDMNNTVDEFGRVIVTPERIIIALREHFNALIEK